MVNERLQIKMRTHRMKWILSICTFFIAFLIFDFSIFHFVTQAAFNQQINYQGKLATGSNIAVADGKYSVRFKLYTTPSGGSPIWTETWCNTSDCKGTGTGADNRITLTSGLFSTMLGSTTSFIGIDFNQTLYIGIDIGGSTASSTWDGEMSPRKIVGAVPAAFMAATSTYAVTSGTSSIALNANTLSGLASSSFLRSDIQNATSSASTFLSVLQSGAGKIAEFFSSTANSALAILASGNIGIGSSTPSAKLALHDSSGAAGTNPLFVIASSSATGTGTTTIFSILGNGNISSAGNITAVGTTTAGGMSIGTLGGLLWGTSGAVSAVSTSSLGLASASALTSLTSALTNGYDARWNGSSFVNSMLSNNGTYAGVNATSSSFTFNVQGSAGVNPFNVASSTGTSLFTVLGNGNVGIGTTTPTNKLEVAGNGYFAGNLTGANITATGTVSIGSHYVAGSGYALDVGNGQQYANVRLITKGAGYSNNPTAADGTINDGDKILFFNESGAKTGYGANGSNGLWIQSTANLTGKSFSIWNGVSTGAPVENFTVLGNGNVGIGTTTPSNKLEVAGNGYIAGNLTGSNLTATGTLAVTGNSTLTNASTTNFTNSGFFNATGQATLTNASTTNLSVATDTYFTGLTSTFLAVDGNHKLIATTTPGGAALSGGNNGYLARWTSASALSTGLFLDSGTYAGVNATSSSYTFNVQGSSGVNPLNIASSTGTSLFTVLGNGNVGIGTTTPTNKVQVYGSGVINTLYESTDNYANFQLYSYSGQAGAASWSIMSGYPNQGDFNIRETGFANDFTIKKTTGNLGIGTTTPSNKLEVAGNGYFAGTITATSTATSTFAGAIKASCFSADGVTCISGTALSGGTANFLTYWTGAGTVGATSSPVVGYIVATSTTATSTFAGGLTVGNNAAFVVNRLATANSLFVAGNGNVGIGTASPTNSLSVSGTVDTYGGMVESANLVAAANGGQVISVSSSFGARDGSRLIDGIITKSGSNDWLATSASGQWAILAFSGTSAKTIGSMAIYNQDEYGTGVRNVKNFRIGISTTDTNDSSFSIIYSGILPNLGAPNPNVPQVISFSPVSAKYVKFYADTNHGDPSYMGLMEIKIYALQAVAGSVQTGSINAQSISGFNWQISNTDSTYFNTGTNFGIGTSTPMSVLSVVGTSTFAGNLTPALDNTYSLGSSVTNRWKTVWSQSLNTGDLVFGNNFRLLEATTTDGSFATTTGAAMYWQNQFGQNIFNLDQNGNLALSGDICTSNVNCFDQIASTTAAVSAQVNSLSDSLASSTAASQQIGIQNLQLGTSLANSFAIMNANFGVLDTRISDLASESARWNLASATSSTRVDLVGSTFISRVADAVIEYLQSTAMLVFTKITATLAVFTNVETQNIDTQTASVTDGLNMTDSATGQIYCVRITNGDFARVAGKCGEVASSTPISAPTSTPTSTPVVVPAVAPSTQVVNTEVPVVAPSTPPIVNAVVPVVNAQPNSIFQNPNATTTLITSTTTFTLLPISTSTTPMFVSSTSTPPVGTTTTPIVPPQIATTTISIVPPDVPVVEPNANPALPIVQPVVTPTTPAPIVTPVPETTVIPDPVVPAPAPGESAPVPMQ